MIYDRTAYDVQDAKRLRSEKVQKGEELTVVDINTLERGTLTINTLNRIEEKQEELKNLFEEDAYYVAPLVHKSWTYTDYFKQSDFDRILENLNNLKKAYFVYKTTPIVPNSNYRHYETINAVEHILHDLDVMISDIKGYYRECGTFECGEE